MAKHRQSNGFACWHEMVNGRWYTFPYADEFSHATLEYRLEKWHRASSPNSTTEFIIISNVEYLAVGPHLNPHLGITSRHYKLMAVEEMRGLVR